MSNVIMFYVPCSGREEAKSIARNLIKKKLVACANIIDACTSIYEWDGELLEQQESILIVKTVNALHMDVERTVMELHSYECPCIVALDTAEVNIPFAKWLEGKVIA